MPWCDVQQAYLHVYGNSFGPNRYFLLVRFKKPVVRCAVTRHPVEIPKQSIVVGPKGIESPESWRYAGPSNVSLRTLLLDLFPSQSLLHHTFVQGTLYAIATQNPFRSVWVRCPKKTAFRALRQLVQNRHHLTWDDFALLRHFKRNSLRFHRFSAWFYLAHSLVESTMLRRMSVRPSANLGRQLHGILKRSREGDDKQLPPSDFYECQILLTDVKPVGLLCRWSSHVEYVSPMVVSDQKWNWVDVNGQKCTHWFPLYKNAETWNTFGMTHYCTLWKHAFVYVKGIRAYLKAQTSERYRLFYADWRQICYRMLGEK